MLDVRAEHVELVRSLLRAHVPGCEVWAFGSRVDGTAKAYSDLDLVLVGPAATDQSVLSRLTEAFQESDLPFRVDLLDWHRISASFREVIMSRYLVIIPRMTVGG